MQSAYLFSLGEAKKQNKKKCLLEEKRKVEEVKRKYGWTICRCLDSFGSRVTGAYDLIEHPELFSSLNKSLNPCDDFYEFVCRGWIETHEISPFQTGAAQIDKNEQKIAFQFKGKTLKRGIREAAQWFVD